jgi:hypothetical protein
MHTQRERFRTALKERNSSTQAFFDHTNALLASFKTFNLHWHCLNSQAAVSPTFALSPPRISFRLTAFTLEDTTPMNPSKIPQLPVVIEATDVAVLAFNDAAPLLEHSKVIFLILQIRCIRFLVNLTRICRQQLRIQISDLFTSC